MDWHVQYANLRLPPDLIDDYLWLQKTYKQAQEEYRRTTAPIRRFQKVVKDQCVPARVGAWRLLENVWVWNDSVVFELERAWWDDVPGSGEWLAYLRKMYVLDSKRGCGYGSQFISNLLGWAEDSGAAVCLVSLFFGLSRHTHDKGPFFLGSIEEVLSIWETGEIHPVVGGDWLRDWYSSKGFRRAKLLDNDFFSFKSRISDLDQFVFVPKSLDVAAKQAASHRLQYEPLGDLTDGQGSALIAPASGHAEGIRV